MANWCQNTVQTNIMGLEGNVLDHLLVEGHPALEAGNRRQQPVVKPFAPAQPASVPRKRYPRNHHKVQLV